MPPTPDKTFRDTCDLLVIGGGINGCGIARDAAGRDLNVVLVEAGDIGGGTSSASTKLIHGGLRYLEFYEFKLVRKALAEREVLLNLAPHISWPLPFVLPLSEDTRPGWLIRIGLWLYDRLAKRTSIPNSSKIDLRRDRAGFVVAPKYKHAFRYWDGWVDDSRLCILNAQDALARGAEIVTRDGVESAFPSDDGWLVVLQSGRELYARKIVNCTGPWAEQVAQDVLGVEDAPRLNLVQGAHIVVPRIGRQEDALMLQQPDGRVVFVLPYHDRYSLIGTTETAIASPDESATTDSEVDYLLDAANRYISRPIAHDDIIAAFAGVRPLVLEEGKDARETSREWLLHDHAGTEALTVIGGKLTTYRLLAEAVLKKLYPETRPWTATTRLPGGDIPVVRGKSARDAFLIWRATLVERFADYDPDIVVRLANVYGTRAVLMLEQGLGRNLGGIFETELDYLSAEEWATNAEDVLWRRTKLGLSVEMATVTNIESWFAKSFGASYTSP
ncbi:glycerol-3-phosphate dehydrogenase [Pacificimonas sp. ICDLI1SI03]